MANNPKVRNDAMLNTGLSSALDRRRMKKQEELHNKRKAEKEAMRVNLTTQGTAILDWIEQEIKDAANLEKMILNIRTEEDVRAQLLAKQMHIEFLKNAKTRVKKFMKVPKETVKQGDSFDEE